MSHISVMKTAFADRDILTEALRAMGYEPREGENLSVSDGVKDYPVDFLVDIPYSPPIGFKAGKKGWQLTADWFRVLERKKDFESRLKQEYARVSVQRTLEQQGFQIAAEEKDEKGRIRLVLRRFNG